jgi:RimJ/RimL family protein N-acetyltransferase
MGPCLLKRGASAVQVEPCFIAIKETEQEDVADWLSSEVWPFHSNQRPTRQQVAEAWEQGCYIGPDVLGFWVEVDGERVGLLRIQDLSEGNSNPTFDLRLLDAARNRGVGTACLRWLTNHVFETFPQYARMEGQTREDNIAMRRVFRRCGYVKEAHYRAAWPSGEGRLMASIVYGILREDWMSGHTTPVNWEDEPE